MASLSDYYKFFDQANARVLESDGETFTVYPMTPELLGAMLSQPYGALDETFIGYVDPELDLPISSEIEEMAENLNINAPQDFRGLIYYNNNDYDRYVVRDNLFRLFPGVELSEDTNNPFIMVSLDAERGFKEVAETIHRVERSFQLRNNAIMDVSHTEAYIQDQQNRLLSMIEDVDNTLKDLDPNLYDRAQEKELLSMRDLMRERLSKNALLKELVALNPEICQNGDNVYLSMLTINEWESQPPKLFLSAVLESTEQNLGEKSYSHAFKLNKAALDAQLDLIESKLRQDRDNDSLDKEELERNDKIYTNLLFVRQLSNQKPEAIEEQGITTRDLNIWLASENSPVADIEKALDIDRIDFSDFRNATDISFEGVIPVNDPSMSNMPATERIARQALLNVAEMEANAASIDQIEQTMNTPEMDKETTAEYQELYENTINAFENRYGVDISDPENIEDAVQQMEENLTPDSARRLNEDVDRQYSSAKEEFEAERDDIIREFNKNMRDSYIAEAHQVIDYVVNTPGLSNKDKTVQMAKINELIEKADYYKDSTDGSNMYPEHAKNVDRPDKHASKHGVLVSVAAWFKTSITNLKEFAVSAKATMEQKQSVDEQIKSFNKFVHKQNRIDINKLRDDIVHKKEDIQEDRQKLNALISKYEQKANLKNAKETYKATVSQIKGRDYDKKQYDIPDSIKERINTLKESIATQEKDLDHIERTYLIKASQVIMDYSYDSLMSKELGKEIETSRSHYDLIKGTIGEKANEIRDVIGDIAAEYIDRNGKESLSEDLGSKDMAAIIKTEAVIYNERSGESR